jgi:DNA-binding transcriptional ArsR family regulator
MPRASTTSDAFNAVAERRRRDIMDLLAFGETFAVGDLVQKLGLPQPAVSKHLGVLRRVGLVNVLREGQHRYYTLNAQQLKPVHDWVKSFKRFWDEHLNTIQSAAERKARERLLNKNQSSDRKNPS